MNTAKKDEAGPQRPARQLRQGALRALRVLETCPLVPVDAFVHLAGLSSLSSAYQVLARLRRCGLANVRRVDPGYLVGGRSLGCWTVTEDGRRKLALAAGQGSGENGVLSLGRCVVYGPHKRAWIRNGALPLLIATYRLIAALVLERAARGQMVEVQAWERPWVREGRSPAEGKWMRVKMPASAILRAREDGLDPDEPRYQLTRVLLVADLGTAPVVRYRETLRRLFALAAFAASDAKPEVVIAAPDPGGSGTRKTAWLHLVDRIVSRHGEQSLQVRVLTWNWVAGKLRPAQYPDLVGNDILHDGAGESRQLDGLRWPAPARGHEQLLHVIGRHPCLTVDQLAGLLGTAVDRIRRLEKELIQSGLLRRIEFSELVPSRRVPTPEEFSSLGLVELTNAGRSRLAGWLGLPPAAATRYHGVIGQGAVQFRRRHRLLRTLDHTVGANGIFVTFAVAADAVRRVGGSDALIEWRSAAACERRYCKPDGYGCYQRDGSLYGFFLEFDRGTEGIRKYAAKFGAYYRYRDGGFAARDYNGFPAVLFVTSNPRAEHRIVEAARRVSFIRGERLLHALVTSTERINSHPQGILGRIWRIPTTGNAEKLHRWPEADNSP